MSWILHIVLSGCVSSSYLIVLVVSGNGDFPTFTLAEAGTQFSDPEGCKAELT